MRSRTDGCDHLLHNSQWLFVVKECKGPTSERSIPVGHHLRQFISGFTVLKSL